MVRKLTEEEFQERVKKQKALSDSLKPCPLCGERPHLDREEIFCDCGLRLPFEPFYYEQPTELSIMTRMDNALEEAINRWNTRN